CADGRRTGRDGMTSRPRDPDVFISYAHTDADYAGRLVDQLTRAGIAVWRDREHLRTGDRWRQAITDTIRRSKAFIVLMTPAAEESGGVGDEVELAASLGKPILPLLLAGEGLFGLGSLHRYDVTNGTLPDRTFLDAIRRRIRAEATLTVE